VIFKSLQIELQFLLYDWRGKSDFLKAHLGELFPGCFLQLKRDIIVEKPSPPLRLTFGRSTLWPAQWPPSEQIGMVGWVVETQAITRCQAVWPDEIAKLSSWTRPTPSVRWNIPPVARICSCVCVKSDLSSSVWEDDRRVVSMRIRRWVKNKIQIHRSDEVLDNHYVEYVVLVCMCVGSLRWGVRSTDHAGVSFCVISHERTPGCVSPGIPVSMFRFEITRHQGEESCASTVGEVRLDQGSCIRYLVRHEFYWSGHFHLLFRSSIQVLQTLD
jgi:hypothetical protein